MGTYIARRLLGVVPVLVGLSLLVFSLVYLIPGDPVLVMLGPSSEATAENIAALRKQLGFDQPAYVQFGRFVVNALQGDLGRSIRTKRRVTTEISSVLAGTLQLTLAGLLLAVVLGIAMGVVAATNASSWLDNLSMLIALCGVSMPSFWLGLLLILFLSFKLQWFPATGGGSYRHLVMPALTLGAIAAGVISRLVRSSMLEVLRQEYIVAARARGLRRWAVVMRHAMKNALIPVVTVVGLQFGALLAGAVIIETVFSRPGLGRLIVGAILDKDIPVVQGAVLVTGLSYVLVNLAVDLMYGFLDPRIRYA